MIGNAEPDHDAVADALDATAELVRNWPAARGKCPQSPPELTQAASIVEKYRDQDVGVADASNVVLADRYQTRTILTLDRRHVTVLRPIGAGGSHGSRPAHRSSANR